MRVCWELIENPYQSMLEAVAESVIGRKEHGRLRKEHGRLHREDSRLRR